MPREVVGLAFFQGAFASQVAGHDRSVPNAGSAFICQIAHKSQFA
jgi:hypothetical protein